MKYFLIVISLLTSLSSHAQVTEEEARNIFSILENEAGYHVVLRVNPSLEINAYTTRTHIEVTQGLLNFCRTPAELALVMGHELGHWAYQDPRTNEQSSLFELRADVNGDYLCRRIGYSGEACLYFMKHVQKSLGNGSDDGIHPNWDKRIDNVKRNRL